MKKAQRKIDEFAFILLGGIILILILMFTWTTPPEPLPYISPLSIEVSVLRGSAKEVLLSINGSATNVSLKAVGDIAKWTKFSKNNFNVYDYGTVSIIFDVPSLAREGLYSGNIIFESLGGKLTIPVSLNVFSEKSMRISYRQIEPFGEFRIEYSPSEVTLEERKDLEVRKGYFGGNFVGFGKKIEGEIEELKLAIEVEETNGLGNLIVKVNGKEMIDRKLSPGLYEIELPTNLTYVNVEVLCENPGWMFWTSTWYKIKSLKLIAKYKTEAVKEFSFDLTSSEVNNFAFLEISALIGEHTLPTKKMKIKINDNVVFSGKPPERILRLNVTKDIIGNPLFLREGSNKIEFSIEEEGFFEFESAQLIIYYLS